MGYLIDTNVVSELRRPRPHPGVAGWFAAAPSDELHLSVPTVGEIRQGVERLRPRDATRADDIERWLGDLHRQFADRVIAIDRAIAEKWGTFTAQRPLPVVDGLLAATAAIRGWTLVTRNTIDVDGLGIDLLNPFEG